MLRSKWSRGTSVIAAIVFAAVLGAIALGLHAMQSSTVNPTGLSAAAAAAATPANQQTCDQAIATAATTGDPTPTETITDDAQNFKDSCNAAVVDPAGLDNMNHQYPGQGVFHANSYMCKGKSGKLTTNTDGTLTLVLNGDTNVAAGTCSVQTCVASSDGQPPVCQAAKQLAGSDSAALASSAGGTSGSGGTPTISSNNSLPAACAADANSAACAAALAVAGTSAGAAINCPAGETAVGTTCMDAATAADACSSGNTAACAAAGVTCSPGQTLNADGSCVSTPTPDTGVTCTAGNTAAGCPSNLPPNSGSTYCSGGYCYPNDNQIQSFKNAGWSCGLDDNPDTAGNQPTVCTPPQTTTTPPPTPSCQQSGTCAQQCGGGTTWNGTQCVVTNQNGGGQQTWYCLVSYNSPQVVQVQSVSQPQGYAHCSTTQAQTNNQNPQNIGGGSTFGQPKTTQPGQQQTCSVLASLFGCQNQTQNQSAISCQLNVQPNPAQNGLPANLTWTSSGNVYSAQITNLGSVPPSGSYTIYPTVSTNYSMMIADQNNNQNQCNVAVNVTPRTGCTGNSSCTSAQTPNGVGTDGQTCMQPPQQPAASQCTVGSWQQVSASNNGCVTGYQCVPSGSSTTPTSTTPTSPTTPTTPTAQISCQPQVADVGESIAISYSCGNATASSGSGFSTNNQTSGSATVNVATPPSGTNTGSYGLTCISGGVTAGAQCSIQINQPSIVLLANPKNVASGQPSTIGWVTAGMKSCVISSPTDLSFTSANTSNFSVNGVAQTSAITGTTEYDLSCATLGGGTRQASTTVSVTN